MPLSRTIHSTGKNESRMASSRRKSCLNLRCVKSSSLVHILSVMEAIPGLVHIIRYGSTRHEHQDAIEALMEALLPRVFIGLPMASRHLEEEPARHLFQQVLNLNSSLSLLNQSETRSTISALSLQDKFGSC